MLPRFEIAVRQRPVTVVGTPVARFLAPYAAVAGDLGADLSLTSGSATLAVQVVRGRVELAVTSGGATTRHRSRRHGRIGRDATQVALTLTGHQLTALVREGDEWRARCRVDLRDRLDSHDPAWLAGLRAHGPQAGAFGQLGLRDIRVVTEAGGAPYVHGGDAQTVWLTATSTGPGFFDTAHTSVWSLERATLAVTHRADLFFRRPDGRVHGDHATHLLRDGDRWLVATSTWADFPADKKERRHARVAVTVAESTADLLSGQHVLRAVPLDLPAAGPSVGVWDPHLVRTDPVRDGREGWLVGYVSARRFFDFHPVLASGRSLDELGLVAAATDRTATEGTTLLRVDGDWRVLASDGADSPRRIRRRYPVLDTGRLRETGVLAAPYLSNIPWPTLVPPAAGDPAGEWLMVTFDGTPYGGRLAGYGTHGDVVTLRGVSRDRGPAR
ncbi:MAG TPA: hypothetical protein VNS81_03380 [Nocardioides sp.]|nr:hypothetical protein [Nocardioides sp.]